MLIWKVRRKIWWTSVAHYMVPYGVTMMCMGWSLRWLESGRFRFLIGDLLGMAYLGGAGYPEVVLAVVWFFLCKGIPDLSRMCSGRCDREHWGFPAGAALDSSGYSDCPVCVEMYGHRARPVESAAPIAACRCWPWNQLSGPCSCHLCGGRSIRTYFGSRGTRLKDMPAFWYFSCVLFSTGISSAER